MRQDVVYFIFILILAGLVLRYGKQASQLLIAGTSGAIGAIKTLQMR